MKKESSNNKISTDSIINKINNKKYLVIVSIILVFFIGIIIGIVVSTSNKDNSNVGKYTVKTYIEFPGNLIFSKYDIKFSIGNRTETLYHGENKEVIFHMDEGNYKLTFVNMENSAIRYEEDLVVDSNMELSFRIKCYSDKIDVKTLYLDSDKPIADNQIKIDFSSSKFSGKNYQDVINELKEIGFTNIIEKPVYDIYFDITAEGEIDKVEINSKTDYKRGDIFNKDDQIIVSYHMKDDSDPDKSKSPYYNSSYKGLNYKKVGEAYTDMGFTKVVYEPITTNIINDEEYVHTVTIDGIIPVKDILYSKNAKVIIKYYKYEESSSNLEPEDYSDIKHQAKAKQSFENMGKSLYPYGIKYHWVIGNRDFSYQGDGIWHIEVEVTITNQYNAKRDAIASGNVNFKTEKVENFNIKNKE